MARIFTSGFESNSTVSGEEFDLVSGGSDITIQSNIVHSGLYAGEINLTANSSRYFAKYFYATDSNGAFYFRFYFRVDTLPTGETSSIFRLGDSGGNTSILIDINTSGQLILRRDTANQVGSNSPTLTLTSWNCIEVSFDTRLGAPYHKLHSKLNGVEFAGADNLTVNNPTASRVFLGANLISSGGSVGVWYFDDIGINDSLGGSEFNSWLGALTFEAIHKRYYYKIYSSAQRYITSWETDVISDPQFRSVLNGGTGELKIQLARRYDSFGEGSDVALQNRVELWVGDADNVANDAIVDTQWDSAMWDIDLWDSKIKSFVKIYSGFISAYAPLLDDENQIIEVTVLGYVVEASYRILKDSSGNTTVSYSSQDPGTILTNIIDKYRADGGTNISYLGSSIATTGTTVSYTFNNNTLAECFDIIVSLCPYGYYWYLDSNGVIYLQQYSLTSASHSVTIGKDISYLQTTKRIENLINRVLLIGGGNPNLFLRYDRSSSQSTYGIFERKVQNGQVTDNTTADYIAKSILDQNDSPETRTVLKIVDNNGENSYSGANIESFRIGDSIQIKNINYGTKGNTLWNVGVWDVDVWDYTLSSVTGSVLVIVSIQYQPDYIQIEAASRLPEVTKRIEVINKDLSIVAQQNLPTVPTIRSV